jgi:hypothetical protein
VARERHEVTRHLRASESGGGRADDRDADLDRRDEPLRLGPQRGHRLRPPPLLIDQLGEPRAPHRHDRDLGAREHAVRHREREYDDQLGENARLLLGSPPAGT